MECRRRFCSRDTPKQPENGMKKDASPYTVELLAAARVSREIRGLPDMAVTHS